LSTKNASLIYIGQGPTVHDKRFLSTLKSYWQTQEIFFPYSQLQIREILKEIEPRAIIAGPLNEVVTSIPSDVDIPIVGISHAFDVNYPENNIHLKSNIDRCAMIITDCKTIQSKIINEFSYFGVTKVIPYGCDFATFSKIEVTFDQKLRILVTRNWTHIHRNNLILEALVILNKNGIDFHCTFIGSGPELQKGKEFAGKFLKSHQYTFCGAQSQNEIASHMSRNWVYVSASESDGSSVSLMEAMSAGMICLVSSYPSNGEWISNGETGYIFNNYEANNLEFQLRKIAELPQSELENMRHQSKAKVSINGDWERNKMLLIEAVNLILEENNSEK